MAALIATTSAFAGNQNGKATRSKSQAVSSQTFKGVNFVDKNNDGVCDNRGTNMRNNGKSFVDKNNDGVCDNYGQRKFDQNRNRKHKGQGKGNGNGNGKKHRKGNGNGNGNGNGRGRR